MTHRVDNKSPPPVSTPPVEKKGKSEAGGDAGGMLSLANATKKTVGTIRPAAGHSGQENSDPQLAKVMGNIAKKGINPHLPRTRT